MIRSVLALRAAPGRGARLEDFYAEHRFLERARAFPGCRDAVLLRSVSTESPADAPTTHLVVADWDSAADYWRWVDEPWRGALAGQLADLLDLDNGPIVGRLYEFV